jgi:hypothetical protein
MDMPEVRDLEDCSVMVWVELERVIVWEERRTGGSEGRRPGALAQSSSTVSSCEWLEGITRDTMTEVLVAQSWKGKAMV